MNIARPHNERMDAADLGALEPRDQVVFAVLVHQEPDRPAVHSINWDAVVHMPVQRLQHEAVAAQRHYGISRLRRHVTILFGQPVQSLLCFRMVARDEGDLLEFSLGVWHADRNRPVLSGSALTVGGLLKCRKTTRPFSFIRPTRPRKPPSRPAPGW